MSTPLAVALALAAAVTAAPGSATAADPVPAPSGFLPSPVLQLIVEDLVPGMQAEHRKAERGWATMARELRLPDPILELTALHGARQCWIVNGYSSFAALEQASARLASDPRVATRMAELGALDRGVVSSERVTSWRLRPELGRLHPVAWARVRYWWVHEVKVRPGQVPAYEREVRTLAAAQEKAGVTHPWIVYQGVAGRDLPAFLVILPMASLAEIDALLAGDGRVRAALGDDGAQGVMRVASDAHGAVESTLLEVRPDMSYVPASWAKDAPDLWKGAQVVPQPGSGG